MPRRQMFVKVQVSVARYLRTPPYAARRKGLVSATRTAYAARAIAGARLSLATVLFAPITVVAHRDKAIPFRRSSILFRPHVPPTKENLVEPPGTAPGSDPLITSAFMSIVRVAPNRLEYKRGGGGLQGWLLADLRAMARQRDQAAAFSAPQHLPGIGAGSGVADEMG